MSTTHARSLPVFMYHYVSRAPSSIAVTPETFEAQCRGLADRGWRGVSLAEAEAYLRDGVPLPERSVLFTFDDGFLDNAVYAAPLLRRYGHHGVIFAVTERLLAGPECRPTLDDLAAGACTAEDLPAVDQVFAPHALGYQQRHDKFLSWDEARRLESSGMAIAAHSARHLAVFASPDWTKLHQPGPRHNTFYRVDGTVLWGLPRFKERPALHSRAFIPSDTLLTTVRRLVPQETAEAYDFFQNQNRVAHVVTRLRQLTPEELGRYETDAEQVERMGRELALCAATLTKELGHPVASFCWPWGGSSPLALSLARDLGFSVFYTTSPGANPPAAPLAVHRFKVRDKGPSWLSLRSSIYANPLFASIYSMVRV